MMKRLFAMLLVCALVMGLVPVTTAAVVDETYKSWDQGDSRWGWMDLGGGNSMARIGCYVTAVAKLLVHAGQQDQSRFTPKECLEGMLAHGMLNAAGEVCYGNFNNSFLPTYGRELYKETSPSHSAWNKGTAISNVSSWINEGYYVIVCVNNKSTGNTHYMAVDHVSDDIYVMDNGGILPLYGTWRYSDGVIDQVKFKYNGSYDYPAIDHMESLKTATIQPGLYTLAPACAPDKRLEAAKDMNVQISSATNDVSQQWHIETLGNGYYKLISEKSGWVLDVANANTTAGTNVQYWKWTENKAQQWCFISTEGGYYQIATRLNSDLRLDVNGAADVDGANVQIWTRNDGPAQKWKLIPVTPESACANGHTWGEWSVVMEATCSAEGQRQRVCSVCGYAKETEAIPALEHDYQAVVEETRTVYTCVNCGDSYVEEKAAEEPGMVAFQDRENYTNGMFSDVQEKDWFSANVRTACMLSLMEGVGGGRFAPGNSVTLAQAVTMAARIHKIYHTGKDSFPRYDGGNWYDPYVDYAREQGIIYENYTYNRPATREEFCHILAAALPGAELTALSQKADFADQGDIVYQDDVALLRAAGIIDGVKENGRMYFKPWNTITRAQAAAIVTRMVKPDLRKG